MVLVERMEAVSGVVGMGVDDFFDFLEPQESKILVPEVAEEVNMEEVVPWAVGKPAEGIVWERGGGCWFDV